MFGTLASVHVIQCPFYTGSDELHKNTIINFLPFYICTVHMYTPCLLHVHVYPRDLLNTGFTVMILGRLHSSVDVEKGFSK